MCDDTINKSVETENTCMEESDMKEVDNKDNIANTAITCT